MRTPGGAVGSSRPRQGTGHHHSDGGTIVSDQQPGDGPDPAEIEPTDNSSGAPVDLNRVQEIEEQDTTIPNT